MGKMFPGQDISSMFGTSMSTGSEAEDGTPPSAGTSKKKKKKKKRRRRFFNYIKWFLKKDFCFERELKNVLSFPSLMLATSIVLLCRITATKVIGSVDGSDTNYK